MAESPAPSIDLTDSQDFGRLLSTLTLEEKVALVSGADFWTTTPIERIGLSAIVLSDGPSGVRGPVWDERSPSLSLPSATALASSWDPDLAYRFGAVLAAEARRKGVHVVLGPTINLHRSPLGGRHFECFSEDPLLSGQIAAAYVRGMQDGGVAATPKHFVANDAESDRFTVDIEVDERALRELYLLPFEFAVEAGAWAIMSSYNSIDGVTMTENSLLEDPLNSQWGFDGVVISDWTAVRSTRAASGPQDLAMPGPASAWSEALVRAVREGRVAETDIDRKVLRLLVLADRVGALGESAASRPHIGSEGFAREAAVEGTVLLSNRGELPWDPAAVGSIAVIGDSARVARIQGGGSATVLPDHVISPLDGIRAATPGVEVRYELGARVQEGLEELPRARIVNPVTGAEGVRVTFIDQHGQVLLSEDRLSSALVWFDGDMPLAQTRTIVLETTYTPASDEFVDLGFASSKHGRVWVDDVMHVDELPRLDSDDVAAEFLAPPSYTARLAVGAGVPLRIRAEFTIGDELSLGAVSATVGWRSEATDADELISKAARTAAAADVAVVVVGTNSVVESEGYDRSSLDLPGRQDDLVRAVIDANPRTVVVVNAGAPVILPWRNDAAAVILGYFGGQEFGAAIADVLFGVAEPGGRLTTSWPASIDDVPVLDVAPTDGVLAYDEGIMIGYRAWLDRGIEPAHPFGSGLGYTTWDLGSAEVVGELSADGLEIRVEARNSGDRRGKLVVQVYAEAVDSAIPRPVRWLVGSAVARADAGDRVDLVVPVSRRRLAHWIGGRGGRWAIEPGAYRLRIGTSVVDLPLTVEVQVDEGENL